MDVCCTWRGWREGRGHDSETKEVSKQIRRCFSIHELKFLVKNTTVQICNKVWLHVSNVSGSIQSFCAFFLKPDALWAEGRQLLGRRGDEGEWP